MGKTNKKILFKKEMLKKMGKESLKIANKNFNLDELYPDLMKIYSKILFKKINFIFIKKCSLKH